MTECGNRDRRKLRLTGIVSLILMAVFTLTGFGLFGMPTFSGADGSAVYAAEPLNPNAVNLYYLEDQFAEKIGELPAEYLKEYQIVTEGLEGTPSYSLVSGNSVTVSAEGLISPRYTVWYWKNGFGSTAVMTDYDYIEYSYYSGTSVVRVTCGEYTQDITVKVSSYSNMYVENRVNQILSETITDDMTELEKYTAVTKWVGKNTDYSVKYQSAKDMLIFECGDCWASTNTILLFCEKLGIEAKSRRGNQDGGSGSGHRNAIARIDGKYYIAEAGYGGTRPRGAGVYEEEGGFSVSGSTIYQYDGFDDDVVVPAEIGGKTITAFGNGKATVFPTDNCVNLTLPATITTIGNDAFYAAKRISSITVDPANESFEMVNGMLYTAGRKKLVYTLNTVTEVTIDPNTEIIGREGLYNLTLDTLVIPSNVKTLELACLYSTKVNNLVIEEGLETICETAFQGFATPKLVVPSSVTTYELGPFYRTQIPEIILADTMTELPEASFYGSSVVRVEIPEGVTSIGYRALAGCSSLVSVSIPKSVTSISEEAFYSSGKLANIYYAGTEEEWNAIDCQATIADSTTVHFNSIRVTGIDPGETEISLSELNQTYELPAKVLPADASNQNIIYTSSNTSVVRVSGNVLTVKGQGECTVTASTEDGGFTAEYLVTVKYPMYKLTIEGGEFRSGTYTGLSEGEFVKDTYIYLKTNKSTTDGYIFTSWEIPEDVTLASGSAASTWITIKMPARDMTLRALYDEIKVTSVYTLGYSTLTMCVGAEQQLNPTVYPANALNKKLSWSSDNEAVMTVDENGKLKAVSAGTAGITATATDGSGCCRKTTFTVRDHNWTSETVITKATCEEAGESEFTCSYCGIHEKQVIPAKGHAVVVDPAVEATTHATGLTEGSHCSTCGKVLVAQEVVPMLPCGWVRKGTKIYYYSEEGVPVTGKQVINGTTRYFSSTGVLLTGWKKSGGKYYYFGKNGVLATGKQVIDGKTYYFDASGVMQTGWKKAGGKWYYFAPNGVMVVGKTVKIGKAYYTFNKNGVCVGKK